MQQNLLVICAVFVISWAWKAFVWVWLKPKKLEKCLREQGIKGPPYNFMSGNYKETMSSRQAARSKPTELSHNIVPRVIPFIHHTIEKYGRLSFCWYGSNPRVNITDPDMIRDILSNKYGDFAKISPTPLGKMLITGVVTYEGEKWVKHRRIVNPAFHFEKLKYFPNGIELLMSMIPDDVTSRPSILVALRCYEEGRRIFQLQTELAELGTKAVKSTYIPGFRFLPTKRNNRMTEIHKEVRALLRDIITKREKAMKTGEGHNDDLLGLLLESNFKEISDNANFKNVGITIDEVNGRVQVVLLCWARDYFEFACLDDDSIEYASKLARESDGRRIASLWEKSSRF
ncbi:hypothetical protein IFM89_025258 [Coptis chinensis]|uniref:Cytochrome P450 n=1 Tax=Coptis chinensis TaxID=261450 RepID=A0A835I6G4_9MAGN|nr:hypothetical protein IFM89_025258 [Coptis chinensis]